MLYAEAAVSTAELKRFLPESEGEGSLVFPYVTPIVRSSTVAVQNLVQPEIQKAKPKLMEWKFSLLALAAAHSTDVATSWNKREMNPMLSPSSGAFGMQTLAIKLAITGGSIALQAILLRRHPELAKMFARINFVETGVIGATAIHNSFVPSR